MFAVGLLALTLSAGSWAGEFGAALMADKSHPGASGAATFGDRSLKIEAQGLRANAVYTVWFVNMQPQKEQAGAGTAPYMFKTDSNGNGVYDSELSKSPVGKWSALMIVLHPNGDPMNMKNMVAALSSMIPKSK